MIFKKILSTLLCLSMMFGTAMPIAAATVTRENESDVLLTYSSEENFVITIPADFTIDPSTGTATASVSASNVFIPDKSILNVNIHSDNYNVNWSLTDIEESANILRYSIGTEAWKSNIFNNSIVLSVESGEAYDSVISQTLYFKVLDALSKAGIYKDTLTFSVELKRHYETLVVDGRDVQVVEEINEVEVN